MKRTRPTPEQIGKLREADGVLAEQGRSQKSRIDGVCGFLRLTQRCDLRDAGSAAPGSAADFNRSRAPATLSTTEA